MIDSHLKCKVANKYLNICERVEVVEWNKSWSPPFPWCPVNRHCLWKKFLTKKKNCEKHFPEQKNLKAAMKCRFKIEILNTEALEIPFQKSIQSRFCLLDIYFVINRINTWKAFVTKKSWQTVYNFAQIKKDQNICKQQKRYKYNRNSIRRTNRKGDCESFYILQWLNKVGYHYKVI